MIPHTNGVSTRRDLREGGLGARAIAARLARGELIRHHRGGYIHPVSKDDDIRLASLGLLAIKRRGMVTSAAALRTHGHRLVHRTRVVDITVPHGTSVPSLDGIDYRRSSHIGAVRPYTHHDLPVAGETWAIGDLARDIGDDALAKVIAAGVAARRWSLGQIEDDMHDRGRFPGRARLRRVLEALRSDLPFSATEARAARALRRAGLEVVVQHPVVTTDGRRRLLDLAIVPIRLNLEIDGPHHWMPEQVVEDRYRDRQVRGIDWASERFTVYEIDRDITAFVREAHALADRRRAELSARSS